MVYREDRRRAVSVICSGSVSLSVSLVFPQPSVLMFLRIVHMVWVVMETPLGVIVVVLGLGSHSYERVLCGIGTVEGPWE